MTKVFLHYRIFADCVVAENAPFHSAFAATTLRLTARIRRKRVIPLLFWVRRVLLKAHGCYPRVRQQQLVNSVLSSKKLFRRRLQNDPKTHRYEDNAKCTSRFWRQRSVLLLSCGENKEWSKFSNIWTNIKRIFENVGCTVFCIY
jgi:hypothetical protein